MADITTFYPGGADDPVAQATNATSADQATNAEQVDYIEHDGSTENDETGFKFWVGAEDDAPSTDNITGATATASSAATSTAFTFTAISAALTAGTKVWVSSANSSNVAGEVAASPAPTTTTATITWDEAFTDAATTGYTIAFREPETLYIFTS